MQTDKDLAAVAFDLGGVFLDRPRTPEIVERCARIIEITSLKWRGVITHEAELHATAVRKHGGSDVLLPA